MKASLQKDWSQDRILKQGDRTGADAEDGSSESKGQ